MLPSLPYPTLDICSIGLALASGIFKGEKLRLLQIGACDGSVGDPLLRYVKSGNPVDAILIEPIPTSFEALKKTYEGTDGVRFLNIAIGDCEGMSEIFIVKDEGRWKNSVWAPQWASFTREHLIRHGVEPHEITSIQVPTLPLGSLISKIGAFPHFLMIDTEGYDATIVRMAISSETKPQFICFEHLHVGHEDLHRLCNELGLAGYAWLHDRMNTLAIKVR